jgi:hypothetical protein
MQQTIHCITLILVFREVTPVLLYFPEHFEIPGVHSLRQVLFLRIVDVRLQLLDVHLSLAVRAFRYVFHAVHHV